MLQSAHALAHLTVHQRVTTLIDDVKQRYGVVIRINQSHRTALQAQEFHVCHMFVHNFFYPKRKPRHVDPVTGRTIDWGHFSDPGLRWALIGDPGKFLRTRHGHPALRDTTGGRWAWRPGHEPDRAATFGHITRTLVLHHVTGMAAPGVDGCGEPCGCGGRASKHITGGACDLHGLPQLGRHLLAAEKGHRDADAAVDYLLRQYLLWRPLAHLPGSKREDWHVEALPPHHGHHAGHHHGRAALAHHHAHGC